MTRDFTGRTAPYGDNKFLDKAIGNYNEWVFMAYIPHSAYEIGVEVVTKTYWCDTQLDHVVESKVVPMFGHCSWYDFEIKDASNDKLGGQ